MSQERRLLESETAATPLRDLPGLLAEAGPALTFEAPISLVVETLLADPGRRAIHVVDAERRLLGTVSWRSVLRATNARLGVREAGLGSLVRLFRDLLPATAGEIMRPATAVRHDETLRDALLKMERHHENDIPVVDGEERLVGEVRAARVMALALETFRASEGALAAEAARQD